MRSTTLSQVFNYSLTLLASSSYVAIATTLLFQAEPQGFNPHVHSLDHDSGSSLEEGEIEVIMSEDQSAVEHEADNVILDDDDDDDEADENCLCQFYT